MGAKRLKALKTKQSVRLEPYATELLKKYLNPQTAKRKAIECRRVLQSFETLGDVTPDNVRLFLLKQKASWRYALLCTLRQIVQRAVRAHGMDLDPDLFALEGAGYESPVREALTRDELCSLFEVKPPFKRVTEESVLIDRMIFVGLGLAGMRTGELVNFPLSGLSYAGFGEEGVSEYTLSIATEKRGVPRAVTVLDEFGVISAYVRHVRQYLLELAEENRPALEKQGRYDPDRLLLGVDGGTVTVAGVEARLRRWADWLGKDMLGRRLRATFAVLTAERLSLADLQALGQALGHRPNSIATPRYIARHTRRLEPIRLVTPAQPGTKRLPAGLLAREEKSEGKILDIQRSKRTNNLDMRSEECGRAGNL